MQCEIGSLAIATNRSRPLSRLGVELAPLVASGAIALPIVGEFGLDQYVDAASRQRC